MRNIPQIASQAPYPIPNENAEHLPSLGIEWTFSITMMEATVPPPVASSNSFHIP